MHHLFFASDRQTSKIHRVRVYRFFAQCDLTVKSESDLICKLPRTKNFTDNLLFNSVFVKRSELHVDNIFLKHALVSF